MFESAGAITGLLFGLILLFLATGIWIGIGISLVGLIVLFFMVGGNAPQLIPVIHFNTNNSFLYSAVPMFIFMGEIIFCSGINVRLYRGANALVGFLPGGLLHTNIASCAVFAAVSGSSMATMATIATVAVPELKRRGYDKKIVAGSLACGGSLGFLIPPSLVMIVYGAFVNESVAQLFAAGLFPGIMLAAFFMLYIGIQSIVTPQIAPERTKASLKDMVFAIRDMWPMILLIFMVLGTIYLGVATPTEAAALGAAGSLVLAAFYRRLNWEIMKRSTLNAVEITSWMMFIVLGTTLVGTGLASLGVPRQLGQWVASLPLNRIAIFAAVILMYIVLGMFLDSFSMILLTLPVIYPLMMALGFSSVWFGVILVLMAEQAIITPPVGIQLYAVQGMMGERLTTGDAFKGATPFLLCEFAAVALLTAFPSIALWLPQQMMK